MEKFKRWLLNTFFKNELIKIYKDYSDEVKKIEYEANKKNGDFETIHRILLENNHSIVGEADNKDGEHVFVVQHVYGKSIDFMLYSNKYKTISNHPRIMATYVNIYNEDSYVRIDDVIVEENNVGNGSILMPYFIDYCKRFTDAKKITGWLSPVDSGHFSRSTHFYKKHGFEVSLNFKGISGSVEYKLRDENT